MFPKVIDNHYKGYKVALYAFYLISAVTVVRSLIHMLATDGGAQSIATIPLDSYSVAAADVVIQIFALWGLSQLLFGLLYWVVLWRYKSLIPFMYALMFIEYAGRLWLTFYKPIILEGTAPGAIGNYIMVPAVLVLFILSLPKSK